MNFIEEKLEEFKKSNISSINLHFTDMFGGFHTLSIPVSDFSADELSTRIPFDGSSIPGFKSVENGDMALKPDFDTIFPYSLSDDENEVGIICDIVEADSGKEIITSPRAILKRAEELIRNELNAKTLWLPEPEFYLFDDVLCFNDELTAMYKFRMLEAMNEDNPSLKNPRVSKKGGYHLSLPADRGYHFRDELTKNLNKLGINIRYHHHEVGAAQNEIEMLPETSIKTADNLMIFKFFAKILAKHFDLAITFMPKPLSDFPGSGLHFHQWLMSEGKSLFWDEHSKYAHLSEIALNYTAGLLYHSRALTTLTNPSVNSFKRLVPNFEAPTKLFFGVGNRSAAVRIPKYVDNKIDKCIEYRPPDFTCNPYLAISGMILAGLDGIRKKLDPAKLGFGPFDENIDNWDDVRKNQLQNLPNSLSESASALLNDYEFLTDDGIFTENMIKNYVKHLVDEQNELDKKITPFEIEKYFEV